MADESQNNGANGPEADAPPLTIATQYIKDYSFEAPSSPGIFNQANETEPNLEISCDIEANPLEAGVFEVVLVLRTNCKIGEQIAFVQELEYAGVFILNVPQEHLQPVLLVECPRLLFPFARNIICDGARDGGFPPIMLNYMDFAGMYEEQVANQTEAPSSPLIT
ncbi:MAG: protein-export chaperone SecB [Rhodospirillaceae bacterium]|jgi:preprotein translocase subunit SecB|nr:protein-export chaperone SecB [Rhodospirillales bacterium]MBT3904695.1 protein-export chaperone SecB [Rhodospirillaceae bacterium]MBT4701401.1 protein-export chaperone SecB [Rhodospirillaceae bacterium]MBT5036229.1 protein-export chaperone SecB [Rhodospirillaceae bacterium]MBT6221637.1 protein-export chaperone SecB [Rhodospirillaceae bacterium]